MESKIKEKLCECKCGNCAKPGNRFINGHQRKGKKGKEYRIKEKSPEAKLCKCGCNNFAKPGNRFIYGHQRRGKHHTPECIKNISKPKKKRKEKQEAKLCECKCGGYATPGNRFINHHGQRKIKKVPEAKLCECGCNQFAKPGNRFIQGHQCIGRKLSKETIEKIIKSETGKKMPKGFGEKISKMLKGITKKENPNRAHTKKEIEKIIKFLTGKKHSKKSNEKNRQSPLKLWQNPEFKEKRLISMFKGLNVKPNKPEKLLTRVFQILLPNIVKYTGNKKRWIGGKNPDFMFIDGQKKIIEFFGSFWHGKKKTKRTRLEEENQRINHFAKYGWKTLIVWENELLDIEKLKTKILRFHLKG